MNGSSSSGQATRNPLVDLRAATNAWEERGESHERARSSDRLGSQTCFVQFGVLNAGLTSPKHERLQVDIARGRVHRW